MKPDATFYKFRDKTKTFQKKFYSLKVYLFRTPSIKKLCSPGQQPFMFDEKILNKSSYKCRISPTAPADSCLLLSLSSLSSKNRLIDFPATTFHRLDPCCWHQVPSRPRLQCRPRSIHPEPGISELRAQSLQGEADDSYERDGMWGPRNTTQG